MKSLQDQVKWPTPGRYVFALSGGVDSVILLDLFASHPNAKQWQLEVAHFNHGWSNESRHFEETSKKVAEKYELSFRSSKQVVRRSEGAAREARYAYLRSVMNSTESQGIVTAHHQDDVIETLILNIRRGTGRRGLTPFGDAKADILRPLLNVPKQRILDYATEHNLKWCEDYANDDMRFARNRVRHQLIPKLKDKDPHINEKLLKVIEEARELNQRIDTHLQPLFTSEAANASAEVVTMRRLSIEALAELLVEMANAARPGTELNRRTIEELAVDIKTGRLRRRRQLSGSLFATPSHGTVTIVFCP